MALGIVGSEILKIAADVRRMQAEGQQVVNLTVGDFAPSEFRIPRRLEDAVSAAIAEGQTNYPPSDGLPELRRAVRSFLDRELGLDYPLEGILVSGGARPLLYGAYRAVLDPGDVVVYPVPSWNNNHYCHMVGAVGIPVVCSAEDSFLPTPELLAPHLRTARMIVLNSPLNPTGTTFSEEALRAVTQAIVDENLRRQQTGERALYLLYDQVYWTLTLHGTRHVDPIRLVPASAPWVILVDGLSKAFAATGLRVGWSCAAPAVTARMRDILGHVGAWAPRPEQRASAVMLDDAEATHAWLDHMRTEIAARLDALYDGLSALRAEGLPVEAIAPAGAIYLSARFDLAGRAGFETNDAIRKWVLATSGTAVVPFNAFAYPHQDGWMRLSIGAVSVAQCHACVDRIGAALRSL
ncbi:MAG: aminotransferase class I/II-fold pyridoxal phosphate-dependent enzyme [Alphaproteobacteria bacterium]|nr:aminotransferase class I/II-fold pyridoxal phosphate-dependent enzyme [Alphaproteobacteria bacterium]MCB9695529.1 aminotransferase class I/II-fold pyridoxal phosphate-dependent enzyme [Alphaproteobacteria bacterium]